MCQGIEVVREPMQKKKVEGLLGKLREFFEAIPAVKAIFRETRVDYRDPGL